MSEPIFFQLSEPAPPGVSWERVPLPLSGSAAVPSGGDWTRDDDDHVECHSPSLGITVLLQQQADVDVADRADYFASFIEVNTRDAPGYRVLFQTLGWAGPLPAARVDGQFDNGTHFATRDYVLFLNGTALMVMARGPFARANDVVALVDQVAASVQG